MPSSSTADEILFDVPTPLGFRVRLSQRYWDLIVSVKHPVMAGRQQDARGALEQPTEIRRSRRSHDIYLFYKAERPGRWLCVVSRRLDSGGFVVTAYPADAVKEGELVWPR